MLRASTRGMPRYLIVFSQEDSQKQGHLLHFRLPELDSLAKLAGVEIQFLSDFPSDLERPFLVVDLPSDEAARSIASRGIAVKGIWEYWADAASYDELHYIMRAHPELWKRWTSEETKWRFSIDAYGTTLSLPEQVAVINSFHYMAFKGDISLKQPEVDIGVFEEYNSSFAGIKQNKGRSIDLVSTLPDSQASSTSSAPLRRIWMGRKIANSSRNMMDAFQVSKRAYFGTTTMEAEVSLLMANQALAGPGKLVYDPFAGTGSLLLTSAAFGAIAVGSDIDGRQMRGKGKGLRDNAAQYGVEDRLLDCLTFDVTQNPWQRGGLFDAIITDPPYGVRAGAKRLGRRPKPGKDLAPRLIPGCDPSNPVYTYELPDYVPATIPWEMTEVIRTLILTSHHLLVPGGRLVFFLPTEGVAYQDSDIPRIEGMRLISNSPQGFGKWERRLITMEKTGEREDRKFEDARDGKVGHAGFRKRYYEKFSELSVNDGSN